ncbi:MAG TPA: hypothetical protein VI382_03840 [Candidatus Manganitrophaceae bacterium]|nr:hypothetical protein [Candidatus Manganitrophaceae bacterium]
MNPLLSLWLLVFSSALILSGIFYLAENYSHIIGNFYFLAGAFFGSYGLYLFISWVMRRNRKGRPPQGDE